MKSAIDARESSDVFGGEAAAAEHACGSLELGGQLPPGEVLERAAEEIRHLARATMLRFVDDVGRIVLTQVYRGDVAAWRSHAGSRTTLRELSRRLDGFAMGAATLYRCVATHVLFERHGALRELPSLTPTHVRAVLPLPEEAQPGLLREADRQGWSARELEREVRRRQPDSARGRPRRPEILHSLARLQRAAEEVLRARPEQLSDDDLSAAFAAVMEARAVLDRAQERFHPRRRRFPGAVARGA